MKTHELAKALRQLAKILETSPNIEFNESTNLSIGESSAMGTSSIAVNIHTLHTLSKIEKRQWIAFVEEFKFPINIDNRDSSRNIMGKILSFLDANPSAVNLIKNKSKASKSAPPSALTQALDILLRD